jgi:polar amino acid transport system substrate-binding protein
MKERIKMKYTNQTTKMKFLYLLAILCFIYPTISQSTQSNPLTITYAIGPPSVPLYELEPAKESGWKGLFIEIAEKIFDDLGYKVVIEQYPWTRAQQKVKEGYVDFTVSIPTAERLKYALKSDEPILQMYFNIYTYADHPKLDEIRKIKTVQDIISLKLKPVTNLGNGWHKENIEDAGVTTFYVPNDENLVHFLALKRADIMIDAPIFMNYLAKENNLESKIVKTDVLFGPINFHLLVSKNSKYADLMPEINKTINKLVHNGILEQMVSRYSHQ